MEPDSLTKIYSGKSIFITGASGFLGKILVEKLLYSVPDIRHIFLLIRPGKNEASPKDRLSRMLENPVFNRVRYSNPTLLKKLIPVKGDMMAENLGLSDDDAELLCGDVAFVFHCAATVKFDEPLKASIQMNVVGTHRLVLFCRRIRNLIVLGWLGRNKTFYYNLTRVEERVYETSAKPSQLIAAVNWMSDEMLNALTPILLRNRPNTYTFAKAVAENLLLEEAKDLPLIIVRPSIIGSCWKEPLPGWTDNMNGPTGIFVGVGKGLITDMCGSKKAKADIVPVDIVANALIVAAAHVAKKATTADKVEGTVTVPLVVHCSSGVLNPLRWDKIVNYLEQFFHEYPLESCYRVPSTQFHSSKRLFAMSFYLKHYYPAFLLDVMARLVGKKTSLARIYSRIWRMIETLHYFTTRGWHFESHNLLKLWDELSDEDQKTFSCDVRQIDWDRYLFIYIMGVRSYLLGENLDDLPWARSRLIWLGQLSFYANMAVWTIIVRLIAWKRTVKERWTWGTLGVLATYTLQNLNKMCRERVHLPTLEDYKQAALPVYAKAHLND